MTEDSAHVLVVGSKPRCTIPDARITACYAANAALLRVQSLPPETKLISVMSRDYAMDYRQVITDNLARLEDCRADEFILIGALMFQPLSPSFRRVVGRRTLRMKRAYHRTLATVSRIGVKDALRSVRQHGVKPDIVFRILWKHELMSLKPSTGLYAVLLAAAAYPDAHIHVSGVGLAADGDFANEGVSSRAHVGIDRLLIRRLSETGSVTFHDLD